MKKNQHIDLIDKFHSVLSFHKKLDESLIPPFKEVFNNKEKQFITLHTIGSHWYFENRYSKKYKFFNPTIKSKHLPASTKEELINSYDNTVLYFDFFVNKIIEISKKSTTPTLIIYMADHGEILGENGKWLHAQEDKSSTNPAMLIWYSNNFKDTFPNYVNHLKKNQDKNITTDFLFHSILNVLKIQNFKYDKSKSIFNKDMEF